MKHLKVERKIVERNKLFGLELLDLLILITIYLMTFLLSKNLILNLGILIASYLFLKLYKTGKPPHFSESLVRFLMTKRHTPLRREQTKEAFNK